MLSKIKNLLWIVTCLVALHSCTPEEFKTTDVRFEEINPEYAIPLINDELTLDNLIKNSGKIKKYNDGFVSLIYSGQIYSATAGEAINIPNQNISQTLSLTAANANALMSGQSQTISVQSNQSFNMGSREIDSIWLKAGSLAASISSEIKTSGNLKITFEDAKNLGVVLTLDIPFSYGGSIPVLASGNKPLAGHKWDMTKGGPGYNNVNIKFDLTLNPTTETVTMADKMDITIGFTGMKFSRFYGYIGTVNLLNAGDTIDLDVFENATGGQFTLEDAKIKIICGNSFGVPVKTGITRLAGFTKEPGGFETDITGDLDPLPVKVPNASQIGLMVYDSVTIEKSKGSNIATVMNQKPKQIIYQTYVTLNPNGKQQRNFVFDYSRLKFTVEVELPLYGTARNFVLESEDTVSFPVPKDDLIENVMIRFTGTNGFPFDLSTQAYLIDSLGQMFDSIFIDRSYKFLEGANVGADGKVTSPTVKTTDVLFEGHRAFRLNRLYKIKIRAELSTTSAGGTYPSVKLYTNYVLGVKIGVKTKLNLKIDKL